MDGLRIDQLRYFECLARTLNYTKAAEKLFITQPALSAAIKRMEKELGFALFKREQGSQAIQLTEAGEVFHKHVSISLMHYDAGLRLAHEKLGQINSTLRVGTLYAVQGPIWSQAMQEFRDAYQDDVPEIKIEQAYSSVLVDRLRTGELDVVFAGRITTSEDLQHILVWSQSLVLAVNKDHPLARRESVDVDELAGAALMTYTPASPVTASIDRFPELKALHLVREFDDEITMSSLVSADPGNMALMCYSFLSEAFKNVVYLPIRGIPKDFHKIYLVSRFEDHPQIVSDFINFMASYRFPGAMNG